MNAYSAVARPDASNGAAQLIRTATSRTFDELVINGAGPTVVEFMSYECSHCRALAPIYQEVAAALAVEVRFFQVDIAADQALAAAYQITGTPTLVFFADGKEVGRIDGPAPSVPSLLTSIREPFEL